jgi:hypothetical protein
MASDDFGEEYLLIENRGACGYDLQLKTDSVDRQGIVIWHVDHTMLLGQNIDGMDVIRYDSQKSPYDAAWPGVHSRVSLLCADGQFDLELNKNRGNEYDAFRKSGTTSNQYVAHSISNQGITLNSGYSAAYPNTNSIALGHQVDTGITIEVLDDVKYTMSVKITLQDASGNIINEHTADTQETPAATPGPSPPPVSTPSPSSTADGLSGSGSSSGALGGTKQQDSSNANVGGSSQNKSPTAAPTAATLQSGYSCDNSPDAVMTVSGVGSDPSKILHRECKFISNKPDEREKEFCDAIDESNGKKVYEKCQNECPSFTGC